MARRLLSYTGMRDKTPKIIAFCALSGALLLGIGIGAAEAHVSKLEREALAALRAEAGQRIFLPVSSDAPPQSAVASTPYLVEVTVSVEEFEAARTAWTRSRERAQAPSGEQATL